MFKYVQEVKTQRRESLRRTTDFNQKWSAKDDIPKFMGMPIYSAMKKEELNESNEDDFTRNVRNARKNSMDASNYASTYTLRSRSRSASRTRMNSASRSSLNLKMW